MAEKDFESLAARGHESNGAEFKRRGGQTDAACLAGMIRAVLALANRRDGGLVIVGVVKWVSAKRKLPWARFARVVTGVS